MIEPVAGLSGVGPVISLPIPGSSDAPRVARNEVLARLDGRVDDETAHDIALVVSELVTNSVLHADLGALDTVLVDFALVDDRLAITVTDPGSGFVPRLLAPDPTRPNGFGLHLVDRIAACWGVRCDPGATQVWCEFELGEAGEEAAALVGEALACSGDRTSAPGRATAHGQRHHPIPSAR